MRVPESFFRPDAVIRREQRRLPGATYNLAARLLRAQNGDCLFVPIRSLHYMAVIDAEEIIFVNGHRPRLVELAWQCFAPGARRGLHDPVPYQAVYYQPEAQALAGPLQGQFHAALVALEGKLRAAGTGRVLPLRPR